MYLQRLPFFIVGQYQLLSEPIGNAALLRVKALELLYYQSFIQIKIGSLIEKDEEL